MSKTRTLPGLFAVLGVVMVPGAAGAQEVGVTLAQVEPAGSPCYAVFHEGRDGRGASLERLGPEDVPRIRDLQYSDGGTLNRRVLSVTTGPSAKLVLYDASRYRIPMVEVLPNSRVNLALPVMDSYQLRCETPPALVQPYTPPKFK